MLRRWQAHEEELDSAGPFNFSACPYHDGCACSGLPLHFAAGASRGQLRPRRPHPSVEPRAHHLVRRNGAEAMYNKSAEDVFGWTAEEMQGSPVERLIPEEARDQHRQAFQLAVDKLRSSDQTWAITKRRVPITVLRKSGEEAKLEMTIRGIRFGENEIEFIAVFRDTALPPAESRPFDVPLKPGS